MLGALSKQFQHFNPFLTLTNPPVSANDNSNNNTQSTLPKKQRKKKNTFRLLLSGDHLGLYCELDIAHWDPGYPG